MFPDINLENKQKSDFSAMRNEPLSFQIAYKTNAEEHTSISFYTKIETDLPITIYDVINLDDGQIVLEEFIEGVTISEVMESGKYRYMGTVGYASPEQLGVTQSDARTDIYAVGVLLNVMITGKHPSEKTRKW